MEPATLTLIGTVVGYLVKKIKDSKSFEQFTSEFTDATVNWLKPIFLTQEEKPNKTLSDLESNPDDEINQSSVKIEIAKAVRESEVNLANLKNLVDEINKKGTQDFSNNHINIENSSNVILAPISTGSGTVNIGSNNVNQK